MNAPALSRRLPALLLLLALLVSQWGWLAHEYQAHDNGQVCELCVAGAQLGHGLTGSLQLSVELSPRHTDFVTTTPFAVTATHYTPLQPRAPPRSPA